MARRRKKRTSAGRAGPAKDVAPKSGGGAKTGSRPAFSVSLQTVGGLQLTEAALRERHDRDEAEEDEDVFDAAMFRQVSNHWWLDRAFPGDVKRYLIASVMTCTVIWLIGLATRLASRGFDDLLAEIAAFAARREWQMQPLLLFAHFLCLRLFKGIFSRNFDSAFRHLDVSREELAHYKRWFFGRRANWAALAICIPFVVWDAFFYFPTEQMLLDYGLEARTAEAWFLLALWSFEWLMFGYYCYLIVAGALVVRRIMKKHHFYDPVDLVLTERQYRPLFNVTAQAGSLIFFYTLVHAGYVFYTAAGIGDYAGLGVLVALLALQFWMTWVSVRGELKVFVFRAATALEQSYREARSTLAEMPDLPGIEDDIQRIQIQLKMQLALQQLDYLVTKYESVGRREFLGVLFRMMAPVGSVLARMIRWGSILAMIGLGGAAAIAGGQNGAENADPPAANAPSEPGK